MGMSYLPFIVPSSLLDDQKISRVVQHPGQIVIIEPGRHFHWVISTGSSISERCNFYIQIDGRPSHVENAGRCLQDFRTFQTSAVDEHKAFSAQRLASAKTLLDKLKKIG